MSVRLVHRSSGGSYITDTAELFDPCGFDIFEVGDSLRGHFGKPGRWRRRQHMKLASDRIEIEVKQLSAGISDAAAIAGT
jgi:hypothetical protein